MEDSSSDEEEQYECENENITQESETSHVGTLKTITCTNQSLCKLGDCSNQYPCKQTHYQYSCCNVYSTSLKALMKSPCSIMTATYSLTCHHCNTFISQGQSLLCSKFYHTGQLELKNCSNQFKCKLLGCSNNDPCKLPRHRYSCCGEFVDDLRIYNKRMQTKTTRE